MTRVVFLVCILICVVTINIIECRRVSTTPKGQGGHSGSNRPANTGRNDRYKSSSTTKRTIASNGNRYTTTTRKPTTTKRKTTTEKPYRTSTVKNNYATPAQRPRPNHTYPLTPRPVPPPNTNYPPTRPPVPPPNKIISSKNHTYPPTQRPLPPPNYPPTPYPKPLPNNRPKNHTYPPTQRPLPPPNYPPTPLPNNSPNNHSYPPTQRPVPPPNYPPTPYPMPLPNNSSKNHSYPPTQRPVPLPNYPPTSYPMPLPNNSSKHHSYPPTQRPVPPPNYPPTPYPVPPPHINHKNVTQHHHSPPSNQPVLNRKNVTQHNRYPTTKPTPIIFVTQPPYHHSYYTAPQYVYIEQYRNSDSRYRDILTGLAIHNMGRARDTKYHNNYYYDDFYRQRYHTTKTVPKIKPSEYAVCTLIVTENGKVSTLKIPCEIVSTFATDNGKGASVSVTNKTVCTTNTSTVNNTSSVLNSNSTLNAPQVTSNTTIINTTQCITTIGNDPIKMKGQHADPTKLKCTVEIYTNNRLIRNDVDCNDLVKEAKKPVPKKTSILPPRDKLKTWLVKPPWWLSFLIAV